MDPLKEYEMMMMTGGDVENSRFDNITKILDNLFFWAACTLAKNKGPLRPVT